MNMRFIVFPLASIVASIASIVLSLPAMATDQCQDAFNHRIEPNTYPSLSKPQSLFRGNPHDGGERKPTLRERIVNTASMVLALDVSRAAIDAIRKESESRKHELLQAIEKGEAILIDPRVEWLDVLDVYSDVQVVRKGEIYGLLFFQAMFEQNDHLYAINGELVRVRSSDQSVFIIPPELNHNLAKGMKFPANLRNRSWMFKNFYPRFPFYARAASYTHLLATDLSSWNTSPTGVQVNLQAETELRVEKSNPREVVFQRSFAYVHIEFRETETLIWIRPPPVVRHSTHVEEYERKTWRFIHQKSRQGGLVGQLFQHALRGEMTVLPAGRPTEEAIRELRRSMRFQ